MKNLYLYVSFFNENILLSGQYNIYGKYVKPIRDTFPNYSKLDQSLIKGCIGYLKGRENSGKNCFLLNIKNIDAKDTSLHFDFDIVQELDISNDSISRSLYKFACNSAWVDKKTGYFPLVCIVDKLDFDTIRKGIPNLKKASSCPAELEELKRKNDWEGICNKFAPLDEVKNNREIWDNPFDLYNLAFACSKLGEPKNGLEKDKEHLKQVKKYREYSICFYERCYELEPYNNRHLSALGYRYYLNVMELTKPKGRRDGNVKKEIDNAINWLNKAIELNPRSIKDNYRKGKLIIDKQIDNFKYSLRRWSFEDFQELEKMESEGVESLKRVIEIYESLADSRNKNYFFREYVKSLYALGSFYLDKVNTCWDEYICSKMDDKEFVFVYNSEEAEYIAKGKKYIEKCFRVESDISFDEELDVSKLAREIPKWSVSPVDKLYRLGLANLEIYFILKMLGKDLIKVEKYGHDAEKFLLTGKNVAYEGRKQGTLRRNIDYINEKLAKYYIVSERYDDAIKVVCRCKNAYIKNTYAMALILSEDEENINKAVSVLEIATKERNNLARELSIILLIYAYKITGENLKMMKFIESTGSLTSKKSRGLLDILDLGGMSHESR